MIDLFAKLGIRGGIGFLLGLAAVWWIAPTTAGGAVLLIAIFMIVFVIVGGLVVKLAHWTENRSDRTGKKPPPSDRAPVIYCDKPPITDLIRESLLGLTVNPNDPTWVKTFVGALQNAGHALPNSPVPIDVDLPLDLACRLNDTNLIYIEIRLDINGTIHIHIPGP